MKQNRNVSYLNQNKTKLNYVIKFSLIECSLFITWTFNQVLFDWMFIVHHRLESSLLVGDGGKSVEVTVLLFQRLVLYINRFAEMISDAKGSHELRSVCCCPSFCSVNWAKTIFISFSYQLTFYTLKSEAEVSWICFKDVLVWLRTAGTIQSFSNNNELH